MVGAFLMNIFKINLFNVYIICVYIHITKVFIHKLALLLHRIFVSVLNPHDSHRAAQHPYEISNSF